MKKFKLSVILMLVFGILGYGIGVAISYFTQEGTREITDALVNVISLAMLAIGVIAGLCTALLSKEKKVFHRIMKKY